MFKVSVIMCRPHMSQLKVSPTFSLKTLGYSYSWI